MIAPDYKIDIIRDIIDGKIYFDVNDRKYPDFGRLRLNLFEKQGAIWEKIPSKNVFTVFFINSTNIKLDNKCYAGSRYSLGRPVYYYLGEPVYDRSCKRFSEEQINTLLKGVRRPARSNFLICDECDLIQPSENLVNVSSLCDLDFGENSDFVKFLKEDVSSHTKYYCRNPQMTIGGIRRLRENSRLLTTNVPQEWCFRCDYALTDEVFCKLLGKSQSNSERSSFFYEEFVFNLNFDTPDTILPLWQQILDKLEGLCDTVHNRDIIDRNWNVELRGKYQIGIDAHSISFPSLFLNKLRDRIVWNNNEIKRRWEKEALIREQKREQESIMEEQKRDFNLTNSNSKDSSLTQQGTHYYINNIKLLGVTRLVNNFFPSFDADYWAEIKAPLMDKSKEQLLKEWEQKRIDSAEAGTKLHQRIDEYYHHKNIQTEDKDFALFKQFADAYKLNPYRSEWAIYDEDSNIVGVVDMLDYSNGEYFLYDWKRSDKIVYGGQPIIENRFGESGLRPIENVPSTDYWHYALQLSFYRYILEKNYGIRVKESRLVVLHPLMNLPIVLTTPYMIDEVSKIIEVIKMN